MEPYINRHDMGRPSFLSTFTRIPPIMFPTDEKYSFGYYSPPNADQQPSMAELLDMYYKDAAIEELHYESKDSKCLCGRRSTEPHQEPPPTYPHSESTSQRSLWFPRLFFLACLIVGLVYRYVADGGLRFDFEPLFCDSGMNEWYSEVLDALPQLRVPSSD